MTKPEFKVEAGIIGETVIKVSTVNLLVIWGPRGIFGLLLRLLPLVVVCYSGVTHAFEHPSVESEIE